MKRQKQLYNITLMLLLLCSLQILKIAAFLVEDRLDYRKLNLSSIPIVKMKESEAHSVTNLVFSHNAIDDLSETDFRHLSFFPNTRYLFLDNNKIHEIHVKGFSQLRKLKHIDLSHNDLTSITDDLKEDLKKLPLLRYVNLKRNPIEDFRNIYELIEYGIDIDFDGMSGINRNIRLVRENEVLEDQEYENKTVKDKPRKAFVRDNKPLENQKNDLDSKFRNSIVFNFIAASLVLVVLPMGMVVYYLVNKNRPTYL